MDAVSRNPNARIAPQTPPRNLDKAGETGKAGQTGQTQNPRGIKSVPPEKAQAGAPTSTRLAGWKTATPTPRGNGALSRALGHARAGVVVDKQLNRMENCNAKVENARKDFDNFMKTGENGPQLANTLANAHAETRKAAIDTAIFYGAKGTPEQLEKGFPGSLGLKNLPAPARMVISDLVNQNARCQEMIGKMTSGSKSVAEFGGDRQIRNMPQDKRADNAKNAAENYDILTGAGKKKVEGNKQARKDAIAHNKSVDVKHAAAYKKIGKDITPKNLTDKKATKQEKQQGINQMAYNLKATLRDNPSLAVVAGKNPAKMEAMIKDAVKHTNLSSSEKLKLTEELNGVLKNTLPNKDNITNIKQLGEGGSFGVPFKADFNGSEVLLKELKGTANIDEELRMYQAFEDNPNIAKLIGVYQADGKTFVVQELVKGDSIGDLMANGVQNDKTGQPIQKTVDRAEKMAKIPMEDKAKMAAHLTRDMATGLAALHENGLLHGDVKPDNVMIDMQTMTAKLIDFGTADFNEKSDQKLTTGTPGYHMQSQGGKTVTLKEQEAREVGALGFAMAEMITGSPERYDNQYATINQLDNPGNGKYEPLPEDKRMLWTLSNATVNLDPISNRGALKPEEYGTNKELYLNNKWTDPEMRPMADAIHVMCDSNLENRPSLQQLKSISEGVMPDLAGDGDFGVKNSKNLEALFDALSPTGVYQGGREAMFEHFK